MPVVLVSIAAILALAFMLTHFAEQITAQAAFQLNPLLQRYQNQEQLSFSTKGACVFRNPGINCNSQATNIFCDGNMISRDAKPLATLCTKASITCELPCGATSAACNQETGGKFSTKHC